MNRSLFKILIVDDSEMSRSYLNKLEDEGFEIVAEAINADSALTYLINMPHINLILLDYILINSHLDGRQLAQKIKKNYPDKRIVFFTDYFRPGNVGEISRISDSIIPKRSTIKLIASCLDNIEFKNSPRRLKEEEEELLRLLSNTTSNSNRDIAKFFWENQQIEGFFKEKDNYKDGSSNLHQNEDSSSIENILYYFWQYGLEVKLLNKPDNPSPTRNEVMTKDERAIRFRKAIRSLPGLNNKSFHFQSEIPEIWNGLIKKLDIWINDQLRRENVSEKTLNINRLIEKYFTENQDADWMSACFSGTDKDGTNFVNIIRKPGYLNKHELEILYRELDRRINEAIENETDRLKGVIKQNYLIENYCIKKRQMLRKAAIDYRTKIRSQNYIYPSNDGGEFSLLTKWIEENLPNVDQLITKIEKYSVDQTSSKAKSKAKEELDEFLKSSQFAYDDDDLDAANEKLYKLYKDSYLYIKQQEKNIEGKCSGLLKKLRGSHQIPLGTLDPGSRDREALVNYAKTHYSWETNEHYFIDFLHEIIEKYSKQVSIELKMKKDGKEIEELHEYIDSKTNSTFFFTIREIFNYYSDQHLLDTLEKIRVDLQIYTLKEDTLKEISLTISLVDKSIKSRTILALSNAELLHSQIRDPSGIFNFSSASSDNTHSYKLSANFSKA